MGYIYMITNKINKKRYIGLTRRSLSIRWQGHKDAAKKRNRDATTISGAIEQFGANNFEIKLLEEVADLDKLADRERFWIEHYNTLSPHGYNQNRGGSLALTPVTHIICGKEYRGYGMIADAFGLNEGTVRARFLAGWTPEEVVEIEPPPDKKARAGKKFIIEGVEYFTETELCYEYDISIEKFRARFHSMGWSLEEALEITPRQNTQVIVGGKIFPSLKGASDFYKLNYHTVNSRKKRGWSVAQCLELEPPPPPKQNASKGVAKRRFPLVVNGKEYKNSEEAAEDSDVTAGTIRYRLSRNWPIENLLDPPGTKLLGKQITIDGKAYPSISEACRKLGKNLQTVQSRLNYGWSLEEAFEIVKRVSQAMYEYEIKGPDGTIFRTNNLSEFCREHNLPNQSNLYQAFHSAKHHSYLGYIPIKKIIFGNHD